MIYGHCAIGAAISHYIFVCLLNSFPLSSVMSILVGLEQLCKVAVASTGGVSGTVNVARILVNSGRPMFNIDTKTMQVIHSITVHIYCE